MACNCLWPLTYNLWMTLYLCVLWHLNLTHSCSTGNTLPATSILVVKGLKLMCLALFYGGIYIHLRHLHVHMHAYVF